MKSPATIVSEAFHLWWSHGVSLALLNFLWFISLPLLLPAPPATAVVYTICHRLYRGELWDLRDLWPLFRRLFWPAWQWALLNGAFWLITAINFASYAGQSGAFWLLLRLLWGGLALLWLVLNFTFWPFWLAQADRSLQNTYLNAARFLLLNPFTAVGLVVLAVLLTVVSLVATLPFALALMSWLALLGITAVQRAMAGSRGQGAGK
jgi:hypothetical protein